MFRRLLPVVLFPMLAGATTTFYVGATGETAFGADLLTRGLTAGPVVSLGGLTSGTTIPNVAGSGVSFTGSASIFADATLINLNTTSPVLQVTLPTGAYAIGLHISSPTGNKTWTYGPSGSTMALTTATSFFGAISTVPLEALPTLSLSGPAGQTNGINVYDLKVGSLAATPEPSTLALVGSGLILFPLLAKRRRGAGR